MDFDYKCRGTDKFGRPNPKIIVLKSGKTLIGHTYVQTGDGTEIVIYFKLIENMEDWIANKIELGTAKITIKESEIETVADYKLDIKDVSISQNEVDEINYQRKNIEAIFSSASLAPIFKLNAKYCVGEFAELTPYIAYGDVMNYKFIIRTTDDYNNKPDSNPILVEYGGLDELVNDGWRLD
jgi:hypothetical protein